MDIPTRLKYTLVIRYFEVTLWKAQSLPVVDYSILQNSKKIYYNK